MAVTATRRAGGAGEAAGDGGRRDGSRKRARGPSRPAPSRSKGGPRGYILFGEVSITVVGRYFYQHLGSTRHLEPGTVLALEHTPSKVFLDAMHVRGPNGSVGNPPAWTLPALRFVIVGRRRLVVDGRLRRHSGDSSQLQLAVALQRPSGLRTPRPVDERALSPVLPVVPRSSFELSSKFVTRRSHGVRENVSVLCHGRSHTCTKLGPVPQGSRHSLRLIGSPVDIALGLVCSTHRVRSRQRGGGGPGGRGPGRERVTPFIHREGFADNLKGGTREALQIGSNVMLVSVHVFIYVFALCAPFEPGERTSHYP
jgi:hypothetical protein